METGTTMTLRRGYSRTFIYLALCCCWGSLAVLAFSPTFHNGHSRPVLLKKGSAGDPRVVSTPTSSSPLSSTRSSDAIGGSSGGGGGGGRQQRPVRLNLSEEARDEQVGQLFAWVTRAFAGDERYNDLVLALIAIFADDETRPPPGSKSDLLLGEAVAAQRKEALQQWRRKQQRTQKEQLEGGGSSGSGRGSGGNHSPSPSELAECMESALFGAPFGRQEREGHSLGAMGAGQWTGRWTTRPHALLSVRELKESFQGDSQQKGQTEKELTGAALVAANKEKKRLKRQGKAEAEAAGAEGGGGGGGGGSSGGGGGVAAWERSLSRGARRTLQRADRQEACGNVTVASRVIRSGRPAPHSSLAHFRCVVAHELRVYAAEYGTPTSTTREGEGGGEEPDPDVFLTGLSEAIGRFMGTTRSE